MKDNWKRVKISDIGEIISGGTPSTEVNEFWDGEIVWITPADLSKIRFAEINTSKRKISDLGLNSSSATLIPKNSIVLSSRAPIGYFAVPSVDFSTNQGCKSIRLFPEQDTYFHYYNFLFNVEKFKSKGEGTTFAEISKKEIEKIELEIPPYAQQKKIAKILSTCDEVIEKTEAAIAKYKAIKQGMMHDLFTRGIDTTTGKLRPSYQEAPELYKESALGMIPKEWEVKRLDNYISTLKSGLSRLLSQQDIGIPVMTSGNIQDGKIEYHDLKFWYLNDPQGANIANYILEKGDILLCFINSQEQIGKLAIFEGYNRPCIYTTNLFRIQSKVEHNYNFLFYLLSSTLIQDEIKLITKPAVNQASFTTKDFLNICVPYIRLNEQLKIKEIIGTIDEKLKAEESALQKYKKIKEGLMQDLLTGRVEVSE